MRRLLLTLVAPLLLMAAVLSLAGCGSSGDNSVPTLTPVDITLNSAQDVSQVTIFHFDGSQWNSVFTQSYQGQSTIDISVDLYTGDQYRIETYTTDTNGNLVPLSQRDFTAGAGNQSFGRAAGTMHPIQLLTIEVPRFQRTPGAIAR